MGPFAWRPRFPKTLRRKAALKTVINNVPGSLLDLLIFSQQFDFLLPLACEWAEAQEQPILRDSEPRTETQLVAARLIPVREPEPSYYGAGV